MLVTSNKSAESREILKQGIHIFQLDKYIEKGNEEVTKLGFGQRT